MSIVSNIAEGFSRRSIAEKIHFYNISQGSNSELHSQVIISKDLKYLSNVNYEVTIGQLTNVGKLLSGLIRSTKEKKLS